jgi:hypothetical protein
VKSGSTANIAAGGPLDGVTVTILNADKRIVRLESLMPAMWPEICL